MDHAKTSKTMDHAIVVVVPPTPDASSIATSSVAATGALNSHLETASTSGTANTHASGSHAPQRSRGCQWDNPYSWAIFDFCSSSIQIILLVVFLSFFQDECPHKALQVWAILYGAGWLLMLPLLYCNFKHLREQANQLPQVSPSSQVDESQTRRHQRFRKIYKWLWISLNAFFVFWFVVGTMIVDTGWAKKEAPRLNKLCGLFLIFIYFRFVVPCIFYIILQYSIRNSRPRGARASVIKALPTYKFYIRKTIGQDSNKEEEDNDNNDNNGVRRVSIGGGYPKVAETQITTTDQVVECCICLDPYEDGVELKELPTCGHHFHVQCIDRWLKINGSCPICKSKVQRISKKASTTEPTCIVVTI